MILAANLLNCHPTIDNGNEERRKRDEWCRQLATAQQICWPILMPKLLLQQMNNNRRNGDEEDGMEKLDEIEERKSSISFDSKAENGEGPGKWPKLTMKSIRKHHRWMETGQRKMRHQQQVRMG